VRERAFPFIFFMRRLLEVKGYTPFPHFSCAPFPAGEPHVFSYVQLPLVVLQTVRGQLSSGMVDDLLFPSFSACGLFREGTWRTFKK